MRDGKGNNHKAAGRPDGGQFDRKAGQGSDDDLDMVPAFDPKHLTDDDILALRHAKGAELEAALALDEPNVDRRLAFNPNLGWDDLSALREFTVEAGRPDTITADKLHVLRAHRVDRISVNPQTLDDRVLETIGRRHTAQDIYDALQLVRTTGGFAVNMDLIAGLPGDTPDGFRTTLEQVLALAPENITVHTLSRKRGADLSQQTAPVPDGAQVGEMLDFANTALDTAGYAPYYLYRQKFMSGGFENVGWTRPGQENLYNICIMEELCSILAMGGGASTKLVCPGGRLERHIDPKYPTEYIANIDRICAAKAKLEAFFL